MIKNIYCVLLILTILTGCNTTRSDLSKTADHLALKRGFTKKLVKGGDFWITTYEKINNENYLTNIYIEGDGRVAGKYLVSDNPTPTKAMFINLAFLDPRANVVYMGRPCQYTPAAMNPKCNHQYWVDKRLSEETVYSMNEAINKITKGNKFNLIGFSGGGGMAVLIAARNKQANSILTIAANLDIDSFVQYHKKRPMVGSLNPIDFVDSIKNIPQLHFSGGRDKIVPPFIAEAFVSKIHTGCARQEVMPQAEHNTYWTKYWGYILDSKIVCLKP
jgi:hypothetical protein